MPITDPSATALKPHFQALVPMAVRDLGAIVAVASPVFLEPWMIRIPPSGKSSDTHPFDEGAGGRHLCRRPDSL